MTSPTPEWQKPGYWANRPWEEQLEEHTELHAETCSCMQEDADSCDCEPMEHYKRLVHLAVQQEAKVLVEALESQGKRLKDCIENATKQQIEDDGLAEMLKDAEQAIITFNQRNSQEK